MILPIIAGVVGLGLVFYLRMKGNTPTDVIGTTLPNFMTPERQKYILREDEEQRRKLGFIE